MKFLQKLYSGNYKRLIAIPIVIFIITAFLAFVFPGVPKGIDLSGGTLIIIRSETEMNAKQAEDALAASFELSDLSVVSTSSPLGGFGLTIKFAEESVISAGEREIYLAEESLKAGNANGAILRFSNAVDILSAYAEPPILSDNVETVKTQVREMLADAKEEFNNRVRFLITGTFGLTGEIAMQKKEISPSLGRAFYETAFNVSIFAIILVVIIVFLFFRKIVPSTAVIASALLDVVGALGLMALFQIPLTLSSIPALLMLIGYSIDTDVMLTTKLLKRRDQDINSRLLDALHTGLTMNITTVAALSAMLVLSSFTQMIVIFEIAAVLLFGLIIDLSSTWFMNAPVLLWYMEREGKKHV